jgi:peptidoglycan biosynthesis protein MviN/MurJ (putative lipid II flippase)
MRSIVDRIRQHLANPGSNHRRVAISFLWIGLFALSSKLAGAAKEIAIAWRYGVSETVDAYVFVFNLISWPVAVWFSILTVVLVPLAAKVRRNRSAELPIFQRELVGLTLILGVILSAGYYFGLPMLLRSGLAGLSGAERQVAIAMAAPLTLLLPIGVVIGLCSTWLMASGKHRNTLFEAVPAMTIFFVLLLPAGTLPEPLVWGTVAGLALQLMALAWSLRGTGALGMPLFSLGSSVWLDFRSAIGLMAIGQVLMSFTTLIDQFFAAHLVSGALSTLNYANRILGLILSLLAISIARAVLPVLAESRAKGEADVDSFGLRWAVLIFVLGTILSASIWIGAPWFVEVIFERGAFSAENTKEVATLLRFSAFQLPFFGFSVALAQVLTSDARWTILLISGVIGILIKIISSSVLTPILDVQGLALSNMFVYLANSVFFLFITKWKPIK